MSRKIIKDAIEAFLVTFAPSCVGVRKASNNVILLPLGDRIKNIVLKTKYFEINADGFESVIFYKDVKQAISDTSDPYKRKELTVVTKDWILLFRT